MPAVAKAASPPAPAQPGSPARAEAAARDAASVVADGAPGLAAKPSQAARSASESASQLAPADNPIARLRAAVAAGPDGWTWQRSNGPEQPMNDTVQGWLSQLDEVTRSRWQASLAATDSGMTLRLLRNGRLHTTVHVEASAVRVEATGDFTVPAVPTVPTVPRAALPAATAAALRAALEQATP